MKWRGIDRDGIIALVLLALWGGFFVATFDIETTSYSTIQAYVWPRVVIVALVALTFALLMRSLRRKAATADPAAGAAPPGERSGWPGGRFLARHRNALTLFALFFVFLITLPILGMLLGGIFFVFLALTLLGEPRAALVLRHGAIAVITVGVMWAIFTFWLRVFLPEGMIVGLS